MSRWFRFYDDALNDPKVQRLAPHLFKTWINLLCLASKNSGKIPGDDDVAFQLRISVQDASQQIDDLILAGLVDIDLAGGRKIHNWEHRQYASDSSAERTRKYREKRKKNTCDVTSDGEVTVQNRTDSETYTEKNKAPPFPPQGENEREERKDFLGDLTKGMTKARDGRIQIDKLVRQAEGFGLPVDDLQAIVAKNNPRNRTAYFTTLCATRLREKVPQISEEVVREALWGRHEATKIVMASLMAQEGV